MRKTGIPCRFCGSLCIIAQRNALGAKMMRIDFKQRLRILGAAFDVLLNHPSLKAGDVLTAVMILRQTILFGKESDSLTRKQLSQGVRNLNRGTGLTPRRISVAIRRLTEIGFFSASKPPQSFLGTTLTILFERILATAQGNRNEMKATVGPQNQRTEATQSQTALATYAGETLRLAEQERATHPEPAEVREVEVLLSHLVGQIQATLPPPARQTCVNLLRAGRTARVGVTAEELTWFIRNLLINRPDRFRTWGGVVTAVRQDLAKPPRSGHDTLAKPRSEEWAETPVQPHGSPRSEI